MITAENRHQGNFSTILDKLDENQRKKLDDAIIKRAPSTLKAIHEKFKLTDAGISYDTLYRYSRRVLDQAAKTTLLEDSFADQVDIPTAMMKMVGRSCLHEILRGEATGLDMHRFTLAFHKSLQAVKTLLEIRSLQDAPARSQALSLKLSELRALRSLARWSAPLRARTLRRYPPRRC